MDGLGRLLRQHWLASVLLAVGLALRVLAQLSYRPAIFYIDTVRYLYNSGGNDPVGYRLPLKLILVITNFDVVVAVQHLLGLAMALAIYVVLVRRGVPRWLAALGMAPVLLDAYQLQMEQLVLPDTWFEALIVAGIAVLLLASPDRPRLRNAVIAGLIFGISATFRQVGEILILPALLYVLIAGRGWRATLGQAAALAVAFVVPILAYLTGSQILVGHFYLSHSGVTTTYGRMARAADCATLRLPAVERGLCPTPAQQARGADWLEHGTTSPLRRYYTGPLAARASALVARFNTAVLHQQPDRVLTSYAGDVIRIFAVSKTTVPGDTPVSRWQFQLSYPYLSPHATPAQVRPAIASYGGGQPAVWRGGAVFLRRYQLGGGYTPGPLLAFCGLAGLAVSVLACVGRLRRTGQDQPQRQFARRGLARRGLARRELALSALLFFCCGAAVLLLSDVFEFTWRYQLPALVTLPPAGAAAVAALLTFRRAGGPETTAGLPESSEEVSLGD
jgi:hypothetical protein